MLIYISTAYGIHTVINDTSAAVQKRFPQAIIIGVKKSGTRALLEFLRINPAIKAPGPEVHFFDRNFDKGFDWYRFVFIFPIPEVFFHFAIHFLLCTQSNIKVT